MRMMLKVTMATDKASQAIKDGSLSKIIDATTKKLQPEAAYFTVLEGCRCALFFFDMTDSSELPGFMEPLFSGLDAEVELVPAMNADDLRKGLAAA